MAADAAQSVDGDFHKCKIGKSKWKMILRHSQDHPEFGERMTIKNCKMPHFIILTFYIVIISLVRLPAKLIFDFCILN